MNRALPAVITATLALALSVPPLRSLIEQSMAWHMVVQMPLLVLAGALAARALPAIFALPAWSAWFAGPAAQRLADFNHFGLSSFMAAQGIVAYWMLPLAIDRAVVNPSFDVLKLLTLFISGLLLHSAFKRAPMALQLFFMGYWVAMMAWLGSYFASTDLRLCNAYSQASQVATGWSLLVLGLLLGLVWVANAWRTAISK